MAQQVVIAGAMFEDVPSISVPDANNVYHPFLDTTIASNAAAASDIAQGKLAYVNGSLVTGTNQGGGGGGSWSWMGKNPTLVHTFTSEHVLLKDTGFATWTWSTTAATIRAAQELPQVTLDDQHDYIFVARLHVHFDYGNWSPVSAITDFAYTGSSIAYRHSSTLSAAEAETKNTLTSVASNSDYVFYGKNSSGSGTFQNQYFGLYCSSAPQAATITSATDASPKAVFKTPALSARGSSTYFSQTAFNNINLNTSYYDASYELWSVDVGTCDKGWNRGEATHILNNGI